MRQGAGVETSGRIIDTGARYPLTSQDFFGHQGRRPAPMTKYVYFFGGGRAEGSSVMRNVLGGKGCELAEMTNLGLNAAAVEGLAARTRNERVAWDCYRRFVMMFGDVVLGVRREVFDAELDAAKSRLGVKSDPEVPAAELRKLTDVFKSIISERTGRPFPEDVKDQLRLAINAVFD